MSIRQKLNYEKTNKSIDIKTIDIVKKLLDEAVLHTEFHKRTVRLK
jgi:hypothetical protein